MIVRVAIALVWKQELVLLARRPPGVHLAGLWEFPGGKIEPGEHAAATAEREVFEETRLVVRTSSVRAPIVHAYPERDVELHPVDCALVSGEPGVGELVWVPPSDLSRYELPAANAGLVRELSRASRTNPR